MIAFGCAISEPEPYLRFTKPGLERAAEPDSTVLVFAAVDSIARSYNILLDAAAALPDVEAMVLVHPNVTITDDAFCAKVRAALADPEVAIVGVAGATGVESIAWWDGAVNASRSLVVCEVKDPDTEYQGVPWAAYSPAPAEVEAVDGFLLVLSAWAIQNLRFDETLTLGHGFDVDLCFAAREAGRKVMTADLGVLERRPLDIVTELELWTEAHADFARKWSGRIPGHAAPREDTQSRARRAEAERESARSMSYFKRLSYDAQIATLERRLRDLEGSLSWRVTRPLREVNLWRRRGLRTRSASDAADTEKIVTGHGWQRPT